MGAVDVRDPYCGRCDRATSRSAALLVQLRKTAGELHRALGHGAAADWMECTDSTCRRAAAVVEGQA